MTTSFEVVQEGRRWFVRSKELELARFGNQMDAFWMAIGLARRLREKGRAGQVYVMREVEEDEDNPSVAAA